MVEDSVPAFEEQRQTCVPWLLWWSVIIPSSLVSWVLWGCIDSGHVLFEGIKKGFAEKPCSGLLGKGIVQWVQGTAGRLEHFRRAWRKKGSESHWDWIPLGPSGFYFTLDGRGLWSIFSRWVRQFDICWKITLAAVWRTGCGGQRWRC